MTANEKDLQLHIVELENKLAFQEDTVNCLSNELLEHQKKIERLHQQVMLLAEKLRNLPDDQGILRPEEEPPPPHY
ncbi:SlyX family protein [Rheinheimera baltica]|uniref:Protein SlyX homolog n=1 Tax=Rheinheimera baltica TaxID=67576 RepID=A0ABT9HW27_9GAMM|nr:SlyX family protein [Rheinheimera baltica]MDP5135183.1 SlyX family protein [Rheinheimera baltica]MDP5143542.1 SlyX family protein [Rheinheimera baltica]MDP5151104.1 SlyX family protein [Rheinheimera baltica]MDP5189998.1 SlyX family protein [Rheinheimera baltica]